jgi:metal-sulfur cluster biosynthetic enzyme
MQIQPPPEKFISTLLEIRDYYAPLVDKYGKLYREALENLNHVQGLLSNWALQEEGNTQGLSQEVKEEMFHC